MLDGIIGREYLFPNAIRWAAYETGYPVEGVHTIDMIGR
jgi:hypothetical protein